MLWKLYFLPAVTSTILFAEQMLKKGQGSVWASLRNILDRKNIQILGGRIFLKGKHGKKKEARLETSGILNSF